MHTNIESGNEIGGPIEIRYGDRAAYYWYLYLTHFPPEHY